jgi:hypothetical protein
VKPEQGGLLFDPAETAWISDALRVTLERNGDAVDAHFREVRANQQRLAARMPVQPVPELSEYLTRAVDIQGRITAGGYRVEARLNFDDAQVAASSLEAWVRQRGQDRASAARVRVGGRSRFSGVTRVSRPDMKRYDGQTNQRRGLARNIRRSIP